jgi:hypothetical protein
VERGVFGRSDRSRKALKKPQHGAYFYINQKFGTNVRYSES